MRQPPFKHLHHWIASYDEMNVENRVLFQTQHRFGSVLKPSVWRTHKPRGKTVTKGEGEKDSGSKIQATY